MLAAVALRLEAVDVGQRLVDRACTGPTRTSWVTSGSPASSSSAGASSRTGRRRVSVGPCNAMLALLFDIHGNLPALEAVLDDARAAGADRYLLGGDYAVFGGWPAETVARLRELPDATWIRGNVDRWAATEPPGGEPARSGVASAAGRSWTPRSSRSWARCPRAPTSAPARAPGTRRRRPTSPPSGPSRATTSSSSSKASRTGAWSSAISTSPSTASAPTGSSSSGPGAVGIPLDGDHRAAWALMHDDGRIERRRVAYDYAASAARVREVAAGAPWGDVVAGRIERARME